MPNEVSLLLILLAAGCAHVKLEDPGDDLFDRGGRPVAAEPFLDILEADLTTSGDDFVLTMRLTGPLPVKGLAPELFYQWDVCVDADGDESTGVRWPLVTNDLGVDYFVRLTLLDANWESEVMEFPSRRRTKVAHEIRNDTITLRWPRTFSPSGAFRFVVTARKYGERGSGAAFLLADKVPKRRHAKFPTGYTDVRPGAPTASFDTEHATFRYNPGDEDRARNLAEAFEFAFREIGEVLGGRPRKRMTYAVYATVEDYVRGLDRSIDSSPTLKALFPEGAATIARGGGEFAPVDFVQHASPTMDWRTLLHEYVHLITSQVYGHQAAAWIVEGIANYLACAALEKTRYRPAALLAEQDSLATARRALVDGRWLALKDLGSMALWDARIREGTEAVAVQYAEGYAVLAFVAQKYGKDRLLTFVREASSGRELEAATVAALGVSAAQLEQDVQVWLRQ